MLPGDVRVGIERAHLEEDTGKSTHFGGTSGRIHGSDYSLVDFNRAGVPLVEIVSRPDIRTSDQARQYVSELRAILLAVGASDAKMEEGSMRVDVNVSVRQSDAPYGTRCEIKNVNSIRSVGKAIEYEARRQIDVLESGGVIRQETRHWDDTEVALYVANQGRPDDWSFWNLAWSSWILIRNGSNRCARRCRCCQPHVGATGGSLEWIRKMKRFMSSPNAVKRLCFGDLPRWQEARRALMYVQSFAEAGHRLLFRHKTWPR